METGVAADCVQIQITRAIYRRNLARVYEKSTRTTVRGGRNEVTFFKTDDIQISMETGARRTGNNKHGNNVSIKRN